MKIKAIKIDPRDQTIKEVEIDCENFRSLNAAIGSDIFAIAAEMPNDDVILVDDEGLINGKWSSFFGFRAYSKDFRPINLGPFAGVGIMIGSDANGETDDVKSSVEDIRRRVEFFPTPQAALSWAAATTPNEA